MATEDWTWQYGTDKVDYAHAASMGPDGSVVLAGDSDGSWSGSNLGGSDFVAVKVDGSGSTVWMWQNGGAGNDTLRAAATGTDGSIVLAGAISDDGAWPLKDFFAIKLNSAGFEQWRWRRGTSVDDSFSSVAVASDGAVVLAGETSGGWSGAASGGVDFAAVKLDEDGVEVWRWQGGTSGDESLSAAAITADGSVVLAGTTEGTFGSTSRSGTDFAAIMLDEDGAEVWRYQEGTDENDTLSSAVIDDDNNIILAGTTEGHWGNGDNAAHGAKDFAIVKLDTSMTELWRWQNGTSSDDTVTSMACGKDSSIVVAGNTEGSWGAAGSGFKDFAVTAIGTGGDQLWEWQTGLTQDEAGTDAELTAITTGGTDDTKALVAGYTYHYSEETAELQTAYAAVSLTMSLPTPTPTPTSAAAPVPKPAPTPAPTALGTIFTSVAPDSTVEGLTPSGTAAPAGITGSVAPTDPPALSDGATLAPGSRDIGISVTPGPSPMSPFAGTGAPSLQMNPTITNFPASATQGDTAAPMDFQTFAPTLFGGIGDGVPSRGLTPSPASALRGVNADADSDGGRALSTPATIAVVVAAAVMVVVAVGVAESKRRNSSTGRAL